MVTGSNDVEDTDHRMAVIRRERHTNVSESVAGAGADSACLGHGFGAFEPVAKAAPKGQERTRIGQGLLLPAWDFLIPVTIRVGQNCLREGPLA
jgi:hypothetical protein